MKALIDINLKSKTRHSHLVTKEVKQIAYQESW